MVRTTKLSTERAGRHAKRPRLPPIVWPALFVGVLLGALGHRSLSTITGQAEGSRHTSNADAFVAPTAQPLAAPCTPSRKAPSAAVRAQLAPNEPTEDDQDSVHAYREQQSGELLELVLRRLRLAEKGSVAQTPEAVANQLLLYQAGMTDALTRLAPELAPHLSARFEQTMCDPQTNAATLVTMTRMVRQMPDLASRKGFDCLFESHHSEDMVLWSALDAMAAAEMPPSPAISRLAATASDDRTLTRVAALQRRMAQASARAEQEGFASEERGTDDEN